MAGTELTTRFTEAQLARILDQSAVYICACPAQICQAISAQRALHAYQAACLNDTKQDTAVHQRIAEAAARAHEELESCLHDVLMLEGWDLATLTMPAHLAKRLADEFDQGCGMP